MEDKLEVELRTKISSNHLKKLKLEKPVESIEHDVYFSYKSDRNRSWIVRTRVKNDKAYLTFKSKKEFGEGVWNEIEIPILLNQVEQLKHFFLVNGFFIDVEIIKERATYKLKEMTINIDKIKRLGLFIECELLVTKENIDSAKKQIMSFFDSLGINSTDVINEGYVSLMRGSNHEK